ncbi:MAG: hypothetical protein A2580_17925 [Hydrogenophilales bacterium RIFOXYD1_FULL_62_11]|nr:MAG: hypothetical protein A2580_17925 [Hydrogenophilales bacterium RIFOXYD1_FULL_62_11]
MSKNDLHLSVGDQAVAVRPHGSRFVRTAAILGRETSPEGVERIWLDRIIAAPFETLIHPDGWEASGAVSTVLERVREMPAAAN